MAVVKLYPDGGGGGGIWRGKILRRRRWIAAAAVDCSGGGGLQRRRVPVLCDASDAAVRAANQGNKIWPTMSTSDLYFLVSTEMWKNMKLVWVFGNESSQKDELIFEKTGRNQPDELLSLCCFLSMYDMTMKGAMICLPRGNMNTSRTISLRSIEPYEWDLEFRHPMRIHDSNDDHLHLQST